MKRTVFFSMLISVLGLSAVQQKNIVEAIFRKLEPIEDLSESIAAKVSNIQNNTITIIGMLNDDLLCSQQTTISSAQTISSSGSYILCNNITGTITIDVSDVTLDLNSYGVSAGVVVNSDLDQVAIKNGTVLNSADGQAIRVNGNTSNVTIENVTAKDALVGIQFNNNDMNATIQGCTLISNTTGLQLNGSHNITVSNTVAKNNIHAGFDLISSTTNSFRDCQALSTGQGNAVAFNNEVAGFVSLNGYGNIFERCIANSTQALSTTDSNSLIAGFALRGTEGCSKIIECEAANATSSPSGFTVPYGILLEGTMGQYISVTGALGANGNVINSVSWSPDGQYVVVGGDGLIGGSETQILKFDRSSNSYISVAGVLSGSVLSASWSPDGQYVAVGGEGLSGGNNTQILRFDRSNNSYTSIAGALGTDPSVSSVSWSPDGQYVAIGGTSLIYNNAQILKFDRTANTYASVAGALGETGSVLGVSWSPDGKYVAVGGSSLTGGNETQILQFDRASNSYTSIAGALGTNGTVNSVSWSPDGEYVAVGGSILTGSETQVLRFDRGSNSYISVAGSGSGFVFSVSWSPDGQYLVVGGNGLSGGDDTQIFKFDKSSNNLTSVVAALGSSGTVSSVAWSPDGQYVAIGGGTDLSGGNNAQILTALDFPQYNVITNNTVYCNSGGQFPSGVGISGPSICNLIIGNTAYSNPIPSSQYHPVVPTNYYFVCNVFNQFFGQAPSDLQNIALGGCGVIEQPIDAGLLSQQILYNVTVPIPSQLDVLERLLNSIIDILT